MSIQSAALAVLAPGMASTVALTGLVLADAHPAVVLVVALLAVAYGWRLYHRLDWH